MVNTFLPFPDFQASAKCLDKLRLNKQITEAVQILSILENVDLLSKYYNLGKMPTGTKCSDYLDAIKWFRAVCSTYAKSGYWLGLPKNRLDANGRIPRDETELIQFKKDWNDYKVDELKEFCRQQKLPIGKRKADLVKCLEQNDSGDNNLYETFDEKNHYVIKLGFCAHPAVRMWLGCQESLCQYIDACISEWRSRGGNSKYIKPFGTKNPVEKPWWIASERFCLSHQASLYRKAPEWYGEKFDIQMLRNRDQLHRGYIWPPNQTLQNMVRLKKNLFLNLDVACDKPTVELQE